MTWNPPDPSDRVPEPEPERTVTYIVHNYAGRTGEDRTFTVEGELAYIIRSEYHTPEAQKRMGITILDDRWTVDAEELPY